MDTVRAFVGSLLDLGATRRVVELGRVLRRNVEVAGWQCAWVPPPNLHVTIKFLGEIDFGLITPLGDALAAVARKHVPLGIGITGVGAFPERGTPRVLFARISRGHDGLAALVASVEEVFWDLGLPREGRAFHGHVTLARVKHVPEESRSLSDLASRDGTADCGTGQITDVTLYRSDVLPRGAEYHVLSRHSLGSPTRAATRVLDRK